MVNMNLKKEELEELNNFLRTSKLDLPSHRKEVLPNGSNFQWLQKNIEKRNKNIPDRLKELLRI